MKRLSWMTALLAGALLAFALPQQASAQDDDPPSRVARLNYIQGSVSFQPAGDSDWVSAITNRPLTTGDQLWTDSGARAELHTGSATIRLDGNTGFSFLNLDDRTVQIQLTQGTIDIRVQRLGQDEIFEVDTPNQAFSITRPGRYRIQAADDGNSTNVTVRQGEGEATGAGQIYSVHAGQTGTFSGTDSLYADIYSAEGNDEFDNWGQGRDRHDDNSQSARYVSHDVVGYQDLDDYGTWRSDPNYGNVWTPTRVSADWAPYREGHWAWVSPWGWTWVDDAPWGYAPSHYGRWVSIEGNWGWVPGPREVEPVYAPALVAFIGGPSFGVSVSVGNGGMNANVGWFPLGPREVYVPGYATSRRYVERVNVSNTTVSSTTITNVYNNQVTNNVRNTNIVYVNKSVRGGVTAVPQSTFTSAQPVARAAVVMNAQQIAAAPVASRAAVAPTKNSVLGNPAPAATRVAQPPAAIVNRPVVAKAPPPPPPVAFEKQQHALAANPGQPLARHEVESLRPTNAATTQPTVKQAPPGKPAVPSSTRPPSQPAVATPGAPARVPQPSAPVNRPATLPVANAPGDKPQSAQPPSGQQQADKTRADQAAQQQASQQQAEKARQQQLTQQQAEKARADQAAQQQASQQQAERVRQQQLTQQQAEKTRADQATQQRAAQLQAEKVRADQAAQQQSDRARQQQSAQQQALQQQAEKARQQQLAQQQAEKVRTDQAAQQQAAKQQAEKARAEQAAQQKSKKPPTEKPVVDPKAPPADAPLKPQ